MKEGANGQLFGVTMEQIESHPGNDRPSGYGEKVRYYCPFHGSDNQRSLEYNRETGHFRCFSGECLAWGYVADHPEQIERQREWKQRKREKPNRQWKKKPKRREWGLVRAKKSTSLPQPNDLIESEVMPYYQEQLTPDSIGAQYLKSRGIPVEVAKDYGLGYSPPGKWCHRNKEGKPIRQTSAGRVVFPHTDPEGRIVNLYGRACANAVPKKVGKHDHLPGPKGVFNAKALQGETVYVTEGAFDAISLIASGIPNACAIFGVNGLRWEWVRVKRMVFAMDQDQAGQQWQQLAITAIMRGIEVQFLEPDIYKGHKDLNETLMIDGSIDVIGPGWFRMTDHNEALARVTDIFIDLCSEMERIEGA